MKNKIVSFYKKMIISDLKSFLSGIKDATTNVIFILLSEI